MQKVDRLGWTAGFSIKTYGVKIGIRANKREWLARVLQYLPSEYEVVSTPTVDRMYSLIFGGPGPGPGVRRLNLLYGDHQRLARSKNVDEIFDRFESDLRLFVAALARNRIFVHAGVVGWKGKAIVIPGRSYSGKSTIVAELVRAGASYYSDEYAVFDARGRVHPFAKDLEMRDKGSFRQTRFGVEAFGGRTATSPIPVGLMMVTEFRAGAKWRPRRLSCGQAVLALLSNTVSARRQPQKVLATLQRVVAEAQTLKGARGEASELAASVLARVEKKDESGDD